MLRVLILVQVKTVYSSCSQNTECFSRGHLSCKTPSFFMLSSAYIASLHQEDFKRWFLLKDEGTDEINEANIPKVTTCWRDGWLSKTNQRAKNIFYSSVFSINFSIFRIKIPTPIANGRLWKPGQLICVINVFIYKFK